jgi:hypothetical protein
VKELEGNVHGMDVMVSIKEIQSIVLLNEPKDELLLLEVLIKKTFAHQDEVDLGIDSHIVEDLPTKDPRGDEVRDDSNLTEGEGFLIQGVHEKFLRGRD